MTTTKRRIARTALVVLAPLYVACGSKSTPDTPAASLEKDLGASVARATRSGGDTSATLTDKGSGRTLASLTWSATKKATKTVVRTDSGGELTSSLSAKDLAADTAPLELLAKTVQAVYQAGRGAPIVPVGSVRVQDENTGITCTPYNACDTYTTSWTGSASCGCTYSCASTHTYCVAIFADCSSGSSDSQDSTVCEDSHCFPPECP